MPIANPNGIEFMSEEEWMVEFGRRLKIAKNRAGLSCKEIAKIANFGHNTVNNWMQGKNRPNTYYAIRLAYALNVNPAWLLCLTPPSKPKLEVTEAANDISDADALVAAHKSLYEVQHNKGF